METISVERTESRAEGNLSMKEVPTAERRDGDEQEGTGVGGTDHPKNSSSSMMLGLLDEFTKIYSDRLQRVEDTSMKSDGKQYLESKVSVLESWVQDLGEQNAVLVATVEELEREAADRVALLEDRLTKMAATTRQSCVSLRDHQIQVSSLVTDKIKLEKENEVLEEKVHALERKSSHLTEENSNLHTDLNSLTQVVTHARATGQWETDDLTFTFVTPEQVFGPVLSSSRRSSPPLKENHHDYFQHLIEDPMKKDNSSVTSSYSNLQDAESSTYGGRNSEKALLIMKLRADLQNLQSLYENANTHLLERDKQIADLQSQLTEMQREMAVNRAETGSVSHTLQELQHQKRHENIEITRREEVIRHILSKKSLLKKDSLNDSSSSLGDPDSAVTREDNVEAQLSENIDVLVSRLAELEEECQQLREQHTALQDSHSLCASTINRLKEQLNKSDQTQVELRTVLTAEVAQRHDQLVALRDELKEQEMKHHETQMQLQLKSEVIKDLRREIRDLKEGKEDINNKSDLTPVKEHQSSNPWEGKCAETQTFEMFTNKSEISSEEFSRTSSGCYSNVSQSSQISRLENELAEKSILLRELQSHLASSRQELHLKDETLYKLEQKLDSSRRAGGEKGERMQYLTGQLTSLQLEVGRTHGQAEQLRRQVENKAELVQKLESENSSLIQQLNDKSSTLERFQTELQNLSSELDNKKKEVGEQRLTISALQDALVSSKKSCDELRSRLSNDVSGSMMHHSHPQQMYNSSNNPLASAPSPGVTKRISLDTMSMQPASEVPSACVREQSVLCDSIIPTTVMQSANVFISSQKDVNSTPSCRNLDAVVVQSVDLYSCAKPAENCIPDVRPNQHANEVMTQAASCASTPDVLSSCNGNSFLINSSHQNSPRMDHLVSDPQSTAAQFNTSNTLKHVKHSRDMGEHQMHIHTGQVYDV